MSSLSHHGIKGQKWGVRRYQNKDGTRTALGKMRHEKDTVIKAGTNLNRITGNENEVNEGYAYMSIISEDHEIYKQEASLGVYDRTTGKLITEIYDTQHTVTKDIHVPSFSNSIKAFEKVMADQDIDQVAKEVGDAYGADNERHAAEFKQNYLNRDKASGKEDAYYNFVTSLGNSEKNRQLLFNELRAEGYDAIWDENDRYEGWMKTPLIIFDRGEHTNQTSATKLKHTSIGGTMYIEGNALILGDSSYLEHHGILGQKWGVRRFQNKDGTRTAAGKKRDAENLKSSQEAKNVNSKIHSYINKQLSSEDLDTGKSNYDFASDLIKDPDFEKVIMPVVQDIRQTKAKYGNKEPYELTGDEHQAYMNDISRIDNKTGELAITIGLAEKGEPHKKSTPPEGEYERVDMFRYALARYLDEHSPDGYSDEGDWIYHSSIGGTMYIEGNALILSDSSYLEHHGIRGQRWGVRRFQNRDGSLTNAGRKRLGYATKGAAQTVGKAFKVGVKAGGNAVKAVKAHHEKKEAEKLQKKKEKASKTRLGVMANKDLFTNEEIRKLNERFKLEDEMKMATLQKGVEIAKAVGTIAQNVGTVAKTYEDITGQSLSPIKRKAAEEKARQEKEDRERRLAREDAEEARKAAKEERDIAIHEQTLRKAIASADTQEFTAQKTKAEADSSILDAIKKGQDFNGGTDATGQSWVEKAKSGGKNPFDDMIANRDPEYAQIRKEHEEKVARKERIAELERREKEREAEKAAAKKQSAPQHKQGGGDDDALFSQKGSLPIDKDRYRNNRAMEKAKQVKEDAAEERAKKQDEKAAKATIDDMMEARRQFTDSARANSNGAFDRETAANYIKGKAKELPSKLNPINAIAKKITDRALKEEEAASRKAMEDEYKKTSRSQGRDEANYTMYYNRVNALQAQGYSERQAKKVADTENPFSSKRNRRFEYNEKVGEIETTHRKNAKEIDKANKELTDYYYKLVNGPGYEPGSPKREALDRKYAQKRGELERLEKDNNEMLDREKKKAKKILEHSLSIQNGVLFIDSSDGLAHHGVKGQRWGVRRFQNPDGSLTEKGRKHYEKAIEKLDRKQVNSDNRRGRLERQHPFAVTASAILTGSAYAALMVASAANPAMVVAGSAIAATVSALGTHVDYSVAEAWEGRGTKRRQKKRKEYEKMLNHDGLMVLDGTLYLEHHGIKGQRWGVRRFQNPDGTLTAAGKKRDARRLQKELNSNDKKWAWESRYASDRKKDYEAWDKAANKARSKGKIDKAEKYEKNRDQAGREREEHIKNANSLYNKNVELMKEVSKKGYSGTAKATQRSVNTGAEIVGMIALNTLAAAAGSPVLVTRRKYVNGTKFKVKVNNEAIHYAIQNGTLFIDAGDPYLEHHGVLGMKWGKHLRAGKGPADSAAGGGGGEDDEKLKEMAKKAGMSVAEYKQKFASKIGGAASKVGEKVYDAAGGSHKKNAEGWRKMAREESNAARASEKSAHENSARAASQDRKYGSGGDVYRRAADSDKENAKTHHSNAKARSERAASEQAAYEKSLAGKYDKMKADRARKKSAKEKRRLLTHGSAEAKRISVKDKHLVINGNRSSGARGLAVGDTGEKPKSFKEKAYNALGGKYKTQASEAHREMITARNDADDIARRANAQGRAANANKRAGNVREYMANKEGARQLDTEAKGARVNQWEATAKANRAQWKYDHSIAGLYDKATGKYKQVHKRTKIPKTMDQAAYYYSEGPNSKLHNNGSSKAKTAKDQAKAAVWNAADHQIKAKEHNDVANSYGGNTNYYGQAYKNAAERESRLSEASYRKAAALGKQASSETSTSSRPRARKKKHTSGGSGVTVRRPGRKPVSRTKRVTQSSTGVRRRGSTGSGSSVRRGA